MEKREKIIILILIGMIMVVFSLIILLLIQISVPKPFCGNGICEMTESQQTCPEDCGYPPEKESICGDGICEKLENEINCPADCGIETTECGDGVCEIPETRENCPEDCKIIQWVLDYKEARVSRGIPSNYILRTEHFDYNARNINEIVNRIREDASSAEDAVKRTAREVDDRLDYTKLSGYDCMTTPASEVLARGYGLCSTMSKVNIAVLRGMGIAARPVVGCMNIESFCRPLAIIPGVPLPKINPIRMEGGRGIVDGGLHAWVEVWLPEKGWVLLESTTGIVYQNPLCVKYNIKVLDPKKMTDFCWVSGLDYIRSCKDNSLFD